MKAETHVSVILGYGFWEPHMQMEVFGWHAQKNGNTAQRPRLTGRRRTMLLREPEGRGAVPGTGGEADGWGEICWWFCWWPASVPGSVWAEFSWQQSGVPRRLHRPAADM